MTDNELAKAVSCLKIKDVWQTKVSAFLDPALEAVAGFPDKYEVRFKHVIQKSLWGDYDGQGELKHILRAFIELGVRYTPASDLGDVENSDQKTAGKKSDANEVLAQIEAVYIAEYLSDEDPGEDAIKAFVGQNASFHVWPYWREFVASQCNRMNLPRTMLPLHNFGVGK